MKLREGGVYRSADGSLVTLPLRRMEGERHYPFTDGTETWTENGQRLQGHAHGLDLVEELNPLLDQRAMSEAFAHVACVNELSNLQMRFQERGATLAERDRIIQQLRIERDLLQRTVADLAVSNHRLTEAYNLGQTVGSAIRRVSRSMAALFQPKKG